MDNINPGNIVYHKATRKRCVVIRKENNGTIVVRDEDNKEQYYYPQELEPRESVIVRRNPQPKPFFDPDQLF